MANTARTRPGAEPEVIDEGAKTLENLQNAYEINKKRINTVAGVVVVAVLGIVGYFKLYKGPQETKANNAIFYAQRYFEADSVNRALNGDGQHAGFLKVEKKFSGTKAANLSHYYAGVCYLKMGDFKNAIKQLEDFDGKGTMVGYMAYGNLGDAYMESGNTKKGIDAYNKAIGNKDDFAVTPLYLQRLGLAYEMNNQPDEAKKAYERIRDEYPQSMQARDMDKNLARLGELN
ncbi:tetratricopeptide repeat protein [Chitinophagaceae bacterium MMS25-I14]